MHWLVMALLAFLIYGLWAFFPKLALNEISTASTLVYEVVGALLVGGVVLGTLGGRLETAPKGIMYGVLTGVFGMLGTLCFLAAIRDGKVSVVVSLSALYPAVTLVLVALFLKEPINGSQGVGIGLAMLSIFFMSR